jgi:Fur family ferric uptake transcriptional regulator
VSTAHGELTLQAWQDRVDEALIRDRQRPTKQRRVIAEALFHHRHFNVDELHRAVRNEDASVGYATVYRTVKLLERVGLVTASQFGDGTARYEIAAGDDDHHDHLICTRCGTIIEFEMAAIEDLQREVAHAHGFRLTAHRLDLFGLCARCQA